MAELKKVNNYFSKLNRKYYYPKEQGYKDAIDGIENYNIAFL